SPPSPPSPPPPHPPAPPVPGGSVTSHGVPLGPSSSSHGQKYVVGVPHPPDATPSPSPSVLAQQTATIPRFQRRARVAIASPHDLRRCRGRAAPGAATLSGDPRAPPD